MQGASRHLRRPQGAMINFDHGPVIYTNAVKNDSITYRIIRMKADIARIINPPTVQINAARITLTHHRGSHESWYCAMTPR